jgi:nitroreductase
MPEHVDHPVLDLIRNRVSVESFQPDRPLDDEQVRDLIRDAIEAPSSFNIQHWRFVAVRSPEDKRILKQSAYGQQQVEDASVTFIVLGDVRGVEKLPQALDRAVDCGALPRGKADAWIKIAGEIYADDQLARDEAIRSGSLAAMILMLAAEARGLAAGALVGFDPEAVKRAFHIEDRYLPVMLLTVGYAATTDERRKPRLDVDEVLAFDRCRKF